MTRKRRSQLLAVGPLPPPLDGTSVSFQIFCDEAGAHIPPRQLDIVDSSPKQLKDERRRFGFSDVAQALRVVAPYIRRIRATERVLIFGSNGFLLKMAPILVLIARVVGRPCFIRPFGGSLDTYCRALPFLFRTVLVSTLRHADGVIVQTQLLSGGLGRLMGATVPIAPGYRTPPETNSSRKYPTEPRNRQAPAEIRLCYVGHVREEKGILILLESLQWIAEAGAVSVRCDIYGPIYDSINDRFFDGLRRTPNAQYKGVVPADRVIATMRTYDAFVFPTHYSGEGHPGVLVEAMMAGLPIVATRFRSLPELIEHEANGLLVEPGDVGSLVEAITELAADPVLRESMAAKSRRMAERYDSRSVVKTILGIVGIQKPTSAEPASWQLH